MAAPRVLVLRAPGTNCDVETAWVFEHCGGRPERIHLFRLLEQPKLLRDFQILCIPGGFSYGDDVGAGVIFGAKMRSHLGDVLGEFLAADKLTLGICNGFQVLIKARVRIVAFSALGFALLLLQTLIALAALGGLGLVAAAAGFYAIQQRRPAAG